MKKWVVLFTGLSISSFAIAQEVSISYDEQQNLVAEVALGHRYDEPLPMIPDSAYVMYWQGSGQSIYDNSIMIGAYEGEPGSTTSPGYFHCLVSSDSPLFKKVVQFLTSANGASTFTVTGQDPMVALDGFPQCLSFEGGGTSTRVGDIDPVWAPFWLYDFQDYTGEPVQYFQGSFVPYDLSNGVLVRGVEAQVVPSNDPSHGYGSISLSAFDNSIVGEGPVFAADFNCSKKQGASGSLVYEQLASAPSRHITFGVERGAASNECRGLYVELSTWLLNMEQF